MNLGRSFSTIVHNSKKYFAKSAAERQQDTSRGFAGAHPRLFCCRPCRGLKRFIFRTRCDRFPIPCIKNSGLNSFEPLYDLHPVIE
jgi:hypothetical protein